MSANFDSLLDKPMGTIEAPKPIPVGSYICAIQSYKFVDAKSGNKGVEFTIQLVQPMDDVDQDALREALGDGSLNEKTVRATYWITPDALFRLQEFLKHVGQPEGIPLREAVQGAQGGQFVGNIIHAPNTKDPNGAPYVNLGMTAPVPQ